MTAEDRSDTWLARVSAALVASSILFLIGTSGQPLRTNWGDPWSDANVQRSGEIFVQEGFIHSAFVPTIDLVRPLPTTPLRYTHYPPLPDLLNGFEQWLIGQQDITVYRLIAIAMTAAALWFLYVYVRRVWSRTVALFALPLFACNLIFLEYADTIHHIPIYWSSGFGALASAAVWLQSRKRWALFTCFASIVVCLMASYDFYFFLPIMLGATIALVKPDWKARDVRLLVAVIAASGMLAVLTKVGCVIAAIGLRGFTADIVHQFLERATNKYAVDYREGFWTIFMGRLWRLYTPLFFATVLAHVIAVIARVRQGRKADVPSLSSLVVLAAGAPFLVLFPQLLCEQYHPTLQLLPYAAIGGGSLLAWAWEKRTRPWVLSVAGALGVYLAWQVVEVVRFPKTFFTREDATGIDAALSKADHRRFVMTNVPVDAVTRTYWNRYPLGIPLTHVQLTLRDHFDMFGGDDAISIVEYLQLERSAYDKMIYFYFAEERHWGWMARPFANRAEWRKRVKKLQNEFSEAVGPYGKVIYESPYHRVRTVTLADLDRVQREQLPEGQTRFIDFETRFAERFELYGFRYPEQYERHHGFAWLNARRPTQLRFTLKGLMFDPVGAPIKKSGLRVRLEPGKDYRCTINAYASQPDQTLSVSVNEHPISTIKVDTLKGPRDFTLTFPKEVLRDDGVQDLEFGYSELDEFDNGLLFHSIAFEAIDPAP